MSSLGLGGSHDSFKVQNKCENLTVDVNKYTPQMLHDYIVQKDHKEVDLVIFQTVIHREDYNSTFKKILDELHLSKDFTSLDVHVVSCHNVFDLMQFSYRNQPSLDRKQHRKAITKPSAGYACVVTYKG